MQSFQILLWIVFAAAALRLDYSLGSPGLTEVAFADPKCAINRACYLALGSFSGHNSRDNIKDRYGARNRLLSSALPPNWRRRQKKCIEWPSRNEKMRLGRGLCLRFNRRTTRKKLINWKKESTILSVVNWVFVFGGWLGGRRIADNANQSSTEDDLNDCRAYRAGSFFFLLFRLDHHRTIEEKTLKKCWPHREWAIESE